MSSQFWPLSSPTKKPDRNPCDEMTLILSMASRIKFSTPSSWNRSCRLRRARKRFCFSSCSAKWQQTNFQYLVSVRNIEYVDSTHIICRLSKIIDQIFQAHDHFTQIHRLKEHRVASILLKCFQWAKYNIKNKKLDFFRNFWPHSAWLFNL